MYNMIAFTGAGGTGKSSLGAEFTNNVASKVEFLRRTFYGEAKFGEFESWEDMINFQYHILYAQIALEAMAREKPAPCCPVTVERSTIDYAAYMANFSEKLMKYKAKKYEPLQDSVRKYINICLEHANRYYDAMLYFPVNTEFINNSLSNASALKERDLKSVKKTDKYIKQFLEDLTNVKIYRLTKSQTSLQKRIDIVNKIDKELTDDILKPN